MKLSDEAIRETAAEQRRRRNLAAMRKVGHPVDHPDTTTENTQTQEVTS